MTTNHTPDFDDRYEHVTCATCGRRMQRIEFRGNPHILLCNRPVELSAGEEFRRQELERGNDGASLEWA